MTSDYRPWDDGAIAAIAPDMVKDIQTILTQSHDARTAARRMQLGCVMQQIYVYLALNRTPCSASDIEAVTGQHPSALSTLIAELENMHLIWRKRVPRAGVKMGVKAIYPTRLVPEEAA